MSFWNGFTGAAAAVAIGLLGSGGALAGEITIGFTGPLSGGAAYYGKNTLTGLEMAVEEINERGGFEVNGEKYTVNLVALDDKYSPSEAAINAKRLKSQYGAPVIFVPHSGGTFALQAFNVQDNFLIASYTSVPTVTAQGNPLTFRIPPSFMGYQKPFAKVEMDKFGPRMAIANADHDYAKAWTKAFVPTWEANGGEIVADNPMSYNKDTDFYSGVARALSEDPDVLFVGGASEPTALVIRQARELGFEGGFAVMDQAKIDEMARILGGLEMMEGAIGVMPLVYDKRPGAGDFVAKFQKKFDRDPSSEISYHYSAMNALTEAMRLAGTVDDPKAVFAKLGDAFAALPADRNPSRIDGIDADGGSNANIVVAFVENGKIVPIELKTYQ